MANIDHAPTRRSGRATHGVQGNEDVARCYALGANASVRKPVDFNEFIAAARTLGVFSMLLNELVLPNVAGLDGSS